MALDAAMLYVTANELREQLSGARIDKIHMPARDEVLFLLRRPDGPLKLLASARSGSARVHITQEEFDNPAVPPSFCMLLRKHLASGRITGVRTVDGERILFIDFDALNEMGDRVRVTLSLELMGRYSNVVLVDGGGKVIDALKRISADQSDKRQLVPGIPFTMPPAQDKLPFLSSANEDVIARVQAVGKPLSAALLDCVAGIGPVLCREIAHRVGGDPDADRMSPADRTRLADCMDAVRDAANGKGTELNIVYDGDKPVEYSFTALTQYTGLKALRFETASVLFDRYYAQKDRAERMRTRSFDLSRQVHALAERAVRKQSARLQEQEDTHKADTQKLYGELINANLHALHKGMDRAELLNYYTGETVSVPLDVTKTPVQNAQKYYKAYKKLTTAAAMLEELLRSGAAEIEYLKSVQYEITQAVTEDDFLHIRKELKEAGYLRGFKYKENKNRKKSPGVLRYRTEDGDTVLVGRNNEQNDKLTLKTADRRDIWFHVKNAPGSHVVLVTEGKTPGDAALTRAAEIAALHSSQAQGQKVPVDYTMVKNVRKAPGQRAGMVVYDHYETAYVTPDADALGALLQKA